MTTTTEPILVKSKRRVSENLESFGYPLGAMILVIILWELVVRIANIPTYMLPAPSAVLIKISQNTNSLVRHSLVTSWEIILGFLLSIIVGIPLAVGIFYSRLLERTFYPFLVASQTIPKVAIAPLFVIWFGFGVWPKVIVAFLIAFFPIVVDTVVGLKQTQKEMIYLAQTMGATPLQTFFKIRLPNALPNIFGGLKVAITLAVVGAVVGEFIASDVGLGYLLVVANGYLDTPLLFSSIVALSIIGIVFFLIIELLERFFITWPTGSDREAPPRATM